MLQIHSYTTYKPIQDMLTDEIVQSHIKEHSPYYLASQPRRHQMHLGSTINLNHGLPKSLMEEEQQRSVTL